MKAQKESKDLICSNTIEAALIGIYQRGGQIRIGQEESRIPTDAIYYAFSRLVREFPQRLPDVHFEEGPPGTVPISGKIEDILFDMGAAGLIWIGGDFKTQVIPRKTKLVWKRSLEKKLLPNILDELCALSKRFKEIVREFQTTK